MHRLLLLGTGGIASHHVAEFAAIPECTIVACVDRLPGRAAAFAAANGIASAFEELEEAIAWDEFDAAINCTPDGVHKSTTLALIAARKHVFCEKPLAPNHGDALAMTEAAEAAGLGVDVEAERHDVEGLLAALLADGWGDVLSWASLAAVTGIGLFHALKNG